MTPFTPFASVAVSLTDRDVDTDVIFPARFLLVAGRANLGQYAFYERRFLSDGTPRPDFPLNKPRNAGARILVAGDNFGCGSSREQAVWAIADLGIRCIISTSFGEIFRSNCLKNGVLPIDLNAATLVDLHARAECGEAFDVDIMSQLLTLSDGTSLPFEVDDWSRQSLIYGWDELMTIFNTASFEIDAYERAHQATEPWLYAKEQ